MSSLQGDRQGQTGKRHGDWQDGTARIVQDEARHREALAALQRKYGWQLSLATVVFRLRGVYRDRVVLELRPSPARADVRAGDRAPCRRIVQP
jgi:hypothetical protein